MSSTIYENLTTKSDSFSWICCSCGVPNFHSSLFHTDISDLSTFNQFSLLDSPTKTFGQPLASSSPKHEPKQHVTKNGKTFPVRSLVINCQSLRSQNKQTELHSILQSTRPDIVFGTESWLDPSISDAEVFPDDYSV